MPKALPWILFRNIWKCRVISFLSQERIFSIPYRCKGSRHSESMSGQMNLKAFKDSPQINANDHIPYRSSLKNP